jgi:hypothetical protein
MMEILDGFQKDMNDRFTTGHSYNTGELTINTVQLSETEQSHYGKFLQVFYKFSEIRFAPSEYYTEILELTKAQPSKVTFTAVYLNALLNQDVVGIVLQYVAVEEDTADILPSSHYLSSGYKGNSAAEAQKFEMLKSAWKIRTATRLDIVTKFKLGCLYQNLKMAPPK